MAETYNISNQIKGDTFDGVEFTLVNKDDSLPIVLTDALIKMQFRKNYKTGTLIKEINIDDGITVNDALLGVFTIDAFLIDWVIGGYYYDVEFTFSDGTVKTFISGYFNVVQDVTNV